MAKKKKTTVKNKAAAPEGSEQREPTASRSTKKSRAKKARSKSPPRKKVAASKKKTPKTVKRNKAKSKPQKSAASSLPPSSEPSSSATSAQRETVPRERLQRRARAVLRNLDRTEAQQCLRARAAFEKHRKVLLERENVKGVDLGLKIRGDAAQRKLAVRIIVHEKDNRMTKDDPDHFQPVIDGVPTDVIARNFVYANCNETPVGGEPIHVGSGRRLAVSTAGMDVFAIDGKIKVLTAAHGISVDPIARFRQVKNQDGERFGRVLEEDREFNAKFDGALIDPDCELEQLRDFAAGNARPIGIRAVTEQDELLQTPVQMYGARSKFRSGTIEAVGIDYDDGEVVMEDHFSILGVDGPFAQVGDSGSVITMGNYAVGILRAVDLDAGVAAACPLTANEKIRFLI